MQLARTRSNQQLISMITSQRCSFSLEQSINAPLQLVWSIVRQFHNPKAYQFFVHSCSPLYYSDHHNMTGVYRKITRVTGYPAKTSIERLDMLDDDTHVMVFSIVGGDEGQRLANYQGIISLHEEEIEIMGGTMKRTIVTEKYAVDVPQDSNEKDTRVLVDTLVGLNLKSLARVAERMVVT